MLNLLGSLIKLPLSPAPTPQPTDPAQSPAAPVAPVAVETDTASFAPAAALLPLPDEAGETGAAGVTAGSVAPAALSQGGAVARSGGGPAAVSVLPAQTALEAGVAPEPPEDTLAEARRLALAAQARFKMEDLVSRLATAPVAPLPVRDPTPAASDRPRVVQPPSALDKLR